MADINLKAQRRETPGGHGEQCKKGGEGLGFKIFSEPSLPRGAASEN